MAIRIEAEIHVAHELHQPLTMMNVRDSQASTSSSVRPRAAMLAYWLFAGASFLGCNKAQDSYAHLSIDVSLAHLTPDQRALVRKISVKSQPEGNEDQSRVYAYGIDHAAGDTTTDFTQEYLPSPQTGTFVVQAALFDGDNQQLGLKTATAKLEAGKVTDVVLDFAPTEPTNSNLSLDTPVSELTPGAQGGSSFTLLWDTDHYLAIVTDLSVGKGDLFSVKLDANGNPISTPVAINSSPRTSILPSLVKVGDHFVIAWQEGNKDDAPVAVQLAILDADGARKGNIRQIPTTAPEARPMLTSAFGTAAIAWSDDHGTPTSPARTALVGLLDPTDLSLSPATPLDLGQASAAGAGEDSFPAMGMLGDKLRVSWVHADSTVFSGTVDNTLALSGTTQLYTSSFVAQQLAVVPAGGNLFTAWEDLSGSIDLGRERIRGAFSAADGTVGANGIVHQIDTGSANWPRMALGTDGSVAVVYYQYRDFGSQIYMTRYTPEGTRVDDADVQLTNVAGEAKYPDVRFAFNDTDGDHFAVGWVDNHSGVPRVYFQAVTCK